MYSACHSRFLNGARFCKTFDGELAWKAVILCSIYPFEIGPLCWPFCFFCLLVVPHYQRPHPFGVAALSSQFGIPHINEPLTRFSRISVGLNGYNRSIPVACLLCRQMHVADNIFPNSTSPSPTHPAAVPALSRSKTSAGYPSIARFSKAKMIQVPSSGSSGLNTRSRDRPPSRVSQRYSWASALQPLTAISPDASSLAVTAENDSPASSSLTRGEDSSSTHSIMRSTTAALDASPGSSDDSSLRGGYAPRGVATAEVGRPGDTVDMAYFLKTTGPPAKDDKGRDDNKLRRMIGLPIFRKRKESSASGEAETAKAEATPSSKIVQKVSKDGTKYLQIITDPNSPRESNADDLSRTESHRLSVNMSGSSAISTEALDSWIANFTVAPPRSELSVQPADSTSKKSSETGRLDRNLSTTSRSTFTSSKGADSGFGLSIIDQMAGESSADAHTETKKTTPIVGLHFHSDNDDFRTKAGEKDLPEVPPVLSKITKASSHINLRPSKPYADRLVGGGLRRVSHRENMKTSPRNNHRSTSILDLDSIDSGDYYDEEAILGPTTYELPPRVASLQLRGTHDRRSSPPERSFSPVFPVTEEETASDIHQAEHPSGKTSPMKNHEWPTNIFEEESPTLAPDFRLQQSPSEPSTPQHEVATPSISPKNNNVRKRSTKFSAFPKTPHPRPKLGLPPQFLIQHSNQSSSGLPGGPQPSSSKHLLLSTAFPAPPQGPPIPNPRTSICSSGTSGSKNARLEARLDALERENRLLEAALMAVLKTGGTLNRCPCQVLEASKQKHDEIPDAVSGNARGDSMSTNKDEEARRQSVQSTDSKEFRDSGASALDVYMGTRIGSESHLRLPVEQT
ncbi:hypothetical protein BT63DRAFT_424974 [Microthyrium microscopicum]|uniref:Uncharacterized protein n=1 Tax=Microthyrium microscopicum TaxID=703497 RepID=A0A6A6UAE8_9PEZI|nr:hypothetical protein BT63DRAFT_424974 [Microthyrium microscopicum]